jgi:hypothetical protein
MFVDSDTVCGYKRVYKAFARFNGGAESGHTVAQIVGIFLSDAIFHYRKLDFTDVDDSVGAVDYQVNLEILSIPNA